MLVPFMLCFLLFIYNTSTALYHFLSYTSTKVINSLNLEKSALAIYENKKTDKIKPLASRCLDFIQLEVLALSYQKKNLPVHNPVQN